MNSNKQDFGQWMGETISNISKAHAYDIIAEQARAYREALEKIANMKKESLDLGESWYDRLSDAVSIARKALSPSPLNDEK